MDSEIKKIWKEIHAIQARNKRVEGDKGWETSWTRKITVAMVTYVLVVIVMVMADFKNPFAEALIPTVAYLISISSLSFLKGWWIKNRKR
jgi:hypothetical protein